MTLEIDDGLPPAHPPLQPLLPPPQVVFWFKIYAGFLVFLYAVVVVYGLAILLWFEAPDKPPLLGSMLVVLGLVLGGMFLLPLFSRPQPWLWTYDIVLICLGMTSACFLPICIPPLIYWLKPETKAWFNRT